MYNAYQLQFAEPLSALPRVRYVLHGNDDTKKMLEFQGETDLFFTSASYVNNIFVHYLTRIIVCELTKLYWQTGCSGRFHNTLRSLCPCLADLLESRNGLGLLVTHVKTGDRAYYFWST